MLPNRTLTTFFALSYALSWIVWLVILAVQEPVFSPNDPASANPTGVMLFVLLLLGGFGPSVAGLVMTHREGGRPALRSLLRSGFDPRLPARAWALCLLLPFLVAATSATLYRIAGGTLQSELLTMPALILPTFVTIFLMGGALNEEFGWRGYALARLEDRYGALRASLLLGALWAFWHLPLFFIAGTGQSLVPLWLYVPLVIAYSIQFSVAHRVTRGRVFAALILHAAINTAAGAFALFTEPTALVLYLLLNVIVAATFVPYLRGIQPATPVPPRTA